MSTLASPLLSNSLQAFSALVRAVPIDWKKEFFVWRSALLRRWTFDFSFYCAPAGLTWSAAGFPDMLTRKMLFEGTYQPEVVAAMRGLVKPGDTVFDVGGHHGLMALVAAQAAGDNGTVVTFEPNPGARQLIHHHARLNRISTLKIEPLALSDASGSATFYVQKGDFSWNSTLYLDFMQIEDREFDQMQVETMKLDQYVEQSGLVPKMIKIDAEGAELVILRGATETIERYKPALSMEFNPESAAAAKSSVGELKTWFESLGYQIRALQCGPRRRGYSIERSELFDEAKHCASTFCNVVCIPPAEA